MWLCDTLRNPLTSLWFIYLAYRIYCFCSAVCDVRKCGPSCCEHWQFLKRKGKVAVQLHHANRVDFAVVLTMFSHASFAWKYAQWRKKLIGCKFNVVISSRAWNSLTVQEGTPPLKIGDRLCHHGLSFWQRDDLVPESFVNVALQIPTGKSNVPATSIVLGSCQTKARETGEWTCVNQVARVEL